MNFDTFGSYYDIVIRGACWIVALIFIVRYSKVNWRATSDGRHIMSFTAMVATFLSLVLITWIFGRQEWVIWVGRAVFLWMLYLLIQRVYLQKKAQDELDTDKPEEQTTMSVSNNVEEKK